MRSTCIILILLQLGATEPTDADVVAGLTNNSSMETEEHNGQDSDQSTFLQSKIHVQGGISVEDLSQESVHQAHWKVGLQSIEERVLGGTKLSQHRSRVRMHLSNDMRLTADLVADLMVHMESGRLIMWDPADPGAIESEYIVEFDPNCTQDGSVSNHVQAVEDNINTTIPGKVRQHLDSVNGFTANLSHKEVADILNDDCVRTVEQDHTIKLDHEELENIKKQNQLLEAASLPWGLDQIDGTMDGKYERNNNGSGVYIYVIDTGVQITHAEFTSQTGSRAVAGADYVNAPGGVQDGDLLGGANTCGGSKKECAFPGAPGCTCGTIPAGMPGCSGHGTHCAGTAAGTNVGVAPGATVVAVRVLNCEGSGTISSVLSGMDYAIRMKKQQHPHVPTVMSMSLGGTRPPDSYADPSKDVAHTAVTAAKAVGVTVVVAAGNSAVDADTQSPAHIDDAITVCASNEKKQKAGFSCFGVGIDICAPGYKVNSAVTGADNSYKKYSGTSMAAPHVAGIMALILQHNPLWTVDQQVSELLTDCVETGTVNMLVDDYSPNECEASAFDDRCKVQGDCHNCKQGMQRCDAKDSYVPGTGDDDKAACGTYFPNMDWSNTSNTCLKKCLPGDNPYCYYGTCVKWCGGKHCDATYMWGAFLNWCSRSYFTSCDPAPVSATPNLLTNLFGKSGKCAATLPNADTPPTTTTTTTTTNQFGTTCFNIQFQAGLFAKEVSWELGTCNSSLGTYLEDQKLYPPEECCLISGVYQLTCKDQYSDGWHGGFLKVGGKKHCSAFSNGAVKKETVLVGSVSPSTTLFSTSAPLTSGPATTTAPATKATTILTTAPSTTTAAPTVAATTTQNVLQVVNASVKVTKNIIHKLLDIMDSLKGS